MKKSILGIIATLALSLALAACGKDNVNQSQLPAPGVNPGNYNGAMTMPLGQYWNGNTWSQCPVGYVQSGNQCTQNNLNNGVCQPGQVWNGYQCINNGTNYNCPYGYTYSQQYGQCVGAYQQQQNNGYTCTQNGIFYVCKPLCPNGQPAQWYGIGWSCN